MSVSPTWSVLLSKGASVLACTLFAFVLAICTNIALVANAAASHNVSMDVLDASTSMIAAQSPQLVPLQQTNAVTPTLSKVSDPTIVGWGEEITYTLSVENTTGAPATGVVVNDTIPDHTTYKTDSFFSSDGTATFASDTLQWDIDTIAASDVITADFVVEVDSTFTYTVATITNTALLDTTEMTGTLPFSTTTACPTCKPNSAPKITIPITATVDEDTDLVFTDVSIADDAGDNIIEVKLTANHGSFTLSTLAGITFSQGDGVGDATMTFTGTLTNINNALYNLTYRGNLHYNSTYATGNDTITIRANDRGYSGTGGAKTSEETIDVTINAVPDDPRITSRCQDIPPAYVGEPFEYQITADDGDLNDVPPDVFIITAPIKPSWTTFTQNGNNAELSGIPAGVDIGYHSLQVHIEDTIDDTTPAATQLCNNDIRVFPGHIDITPTTLNLTERTNPNVSYSVQLTGEPSGNVVVTITGGNGKVDLSTTALTFTTANWSTPQTVNVSVTNNDIADGTRTINLNHTVTGGGYDGIENIEATNVQVTVVDDDSKGVSITETGGSTVVDEDDSVGDTYQVVLTSEPTGNVTINFDVGTDGSLAPITSRTFTTSNWDDPQTISVRAQNNDIADGTRYPTIAHQATGGGYDAVAIPNVGVQVNDDDLAGITLSKTNLSVSESNPGNTQSYTVKLKSEPTDSVTIDVLYDAAQINVSPTTLTFDDTNWDVAQTINVQAVDDAVDELTTHGSAIALDITSNDTDYDNAATTPVMVSITDNETPSVTVSKSNIDVNEGGASKSYTLKLNTQPATNVVIAINSDEEVDVSPASVTFTPTNWNTAQTINVTAVDDGKVEGPHASTINHSASGDAIYSDVAINSVTVNILGDANNPAVLIDESGGSTEVLEGDATGSMYTIRLNSIPTANVVVSFATDDQLNPIASRTFTPANWNVAQTIVVTAKEDELVESSPHISTIAHSASSTDTNYNGISIPTVPVQIIDNDVPDLVITQSGGSTIVSEGANSDTYTVRLSKQPSGNVQVTLLADDRVTVTPNTLSFNTTNWSANQTVLVSAVQNDKVDTNPSSTIAHTASGGGYDSISKDVTVSINDDDAPDIIANPTMVDVTEQSDCSSYTIKLTQAPTATVTIDFATDSQLQTIQPVNITPATWQTPKTINVCANPDDVVEGLHYSTIAHSATSLDNIYDGMPIDDVLVEITDDDAPSISVSPAEVNVAEGGNGKTFRVSLTKQPNAPVTVDLTHDDQVGTSTDMLTFTMSNYADSQSVVVAAEDDTLAEGPHASTIDLSAIGGGYDSVTNDVQINITDNDEKGILITETGNSTDVAEATTDCDYYTVQLTQQPSADVTITLGSDEQVAVSPTEFAFTTSASAWDREQTVEVCANQDEALEGNHESRIHHIVTSNDADYTAAPPPDVVVHITDDDAPGIIVFPTTMDVAEDNGDTTYQVRLAKQPDADVTVVITTNNQVTVSPQTLTFSTTDWEQKQLVVVKAKPDIFVEGPHASTIMHRASGGGYDGVSASATVNIADNDTKGILLDPTSFSVTEGEPPKGYTIQLTQQPDADVTIAFEPKNDQIVVSPAEYTFTTTNWNQPKTINVSAPLDNTMDGTQQTQIEHTITSADSEYQSFVIPDVWVTSEDINSPGLIVSPDEMNLSEKGDASNHSGMFQVELTTKPTADVTVSIAPSNNQVQVLNTALTFTPDNYAQPQPVSVEVQDDLLVEGQHASNITLSSSGGGYTATAQVQVQIQDDDVKGILMIASDGSTEVAEGPFTPTCDDYTIQLTKNPLADVIVTLDTNDQVTVKPESITFTPDGSLQRTATVCAIHDSIAEAEEHTTIVSYRVVSDDTEYAAFAPSIKVRITDIDTPALSIVPTTIEVDEGGQGATYAVALTTLPANNVTVVITTDEQVDVSPTLLTFTPEDWSTAQTIHVNVAAVDDDFVEDPIHYSIIGHAATGGDYTGKTKQVTVRIRDNDVKGILVQETDDSTEVDEGDPPTCDSYTLKLTQEPTDNVEVVIEIDDPVDITPQTVTFTPATWKQHKTIEVCAQDDDIAQGDTYYANITHRVLSSKDPDYAIANIKTVRVTINDDDMPGIVFLPTSLTVAEGGTEEEQTATYIVNLNTQPDKDVAVAIEPSEKQVVVSPQIITFTNETWDDKTKTITVRAKDDDNEENNPHSDTINHTANGGNYTGVKASLPVDIEDNDGKNIRITQTGGSTDLTEGTDQTDQYRIRLTKEPTANVTVLVQTDDQVTVDKDTITFAPATWTQVQTITVQAIDDNIKEGEGVGGKHTGTIKHTSESDDSEYNKARIADVVAHITDDDVPSVQIQQTNGNTIVTEGGLGDTYTLNLTSQPSNTVTINILPEDNSNIDVAPASLVFTPDNWNTPKTIIVSVPKDDLEQGIRYKTIAHHATSTDTTYNNIPIDPVTVEIRESRPGVVITPDKLSLSEAEAGRKGNYTVTLESKPTADVFIALTYDQSQITVSTSHLTFTTETWNITQTVLVEAIDDAYDDDAHHSLDIIHTISSDDGNYGLIGQIDVDVYIDDDDNADITIDKTALSVDEPGKTDTYTMKLASMPTADVLITLTYNTNQIEASPTQLTFTPDNWNQTQTILVSSIDDELVEGPHFITITHTISSDDIDYSSMNVTSLRVDIDDNDTPGVTLNKEEVHVTEGDPAGDTYTMVLNTQPTADVTINIDTDIEIESLEPRIFTPETWDIPQVVHVVAEDDDEPEGQLTRTINHSTSSTDPEYNNIGVHTVKAIITDDEGPGLRLSRHNLHVTEGSSDSDAYTIQLTQKPQQKVTVNLQAHAQIHISPTTVEFDSTNWNEPRTISVRAVDDTAEEGDHASTITHKVSSDDIAYSTIADREVNVTIVDNDAPGISVIPTMLNVTEGNYGSYEVALTTVPSSTVTIALTTDETQVDIQPEQLTFTPDGSATTSQIVTVRAKKDDLREDQPHSVVVQHNVSSADTRFATYKPTDVTVTIIDSDGPGVDIVESGDYTAVVERETEYGEQHIYASDTYAIKLTAKPSHNVTIDLHSDNEQIIAFPTSLTFSPETWDKPQSITIDAKDDEEKEGPHTSIIEHTVSSADNAYNNIYARNVTVHITDNDLPAVVISESGSDTMVTEGHPTGDIYTVHLTTQPTNDVTVVISPEQQLRTSPTTLTFTPDTWTHVYSVTVHAKDDDLEQGNRLAAITHHAISADAAYLNLPVDTLRVGITDDDSANVIITESDGYTSVQEGSTPEAHSDTYTIALTKQPADNVIIHIETDGQIVVKDNQQNIIEEVAFAPSKWNEVYTVEVHAEDDSNAEEHAYSTIRHTATSNDQDYDSIPIRSVYVDIQDNDKSITTCIGFAQPVFEVLEDVGQANITVELRGKIAENKRITFDTMDGTAIAGRSPEGAAVAGRDYVYITEDLVFRPGDLKQTVPISIVNNATFEGNRTVLLRLYGFPEGITPCDGANIAELKIQDNETSADGKGLLQFTNLYYHVIEGAADDKVLTTTIKLKRVGGTQGSITAQIDTFNGTAKAYFEPPFDEDDSNLQPDYEQLLDQDRIITFDNGQTEGEFEISIHGDDIPEGDENLLLLLSNIDANNNLTEQYRATLTIQDDDTQTKSSTQVHTSTIYLNKQNYRVTEGTTDDAIIDVRRTGSLEAIAQKASVKFTFLAGSAEADIDFEPELCDESTSSPDGVLKSCSKTMNFLPGEVLKTFPIPIIDDNKAQGDHTIFLIIRPDPTTESPVQVGANHYGILTIVDDEDDGLTQDTFFFDAFSYFVDERNDTAWVTIRREGPADAPATISYELIDASAKLGQDYTRHTKDITFAKGQRKKAFGVKITSENKVEGDEALLMRLTDVQTTTTTAKMGAQDSAALFISDDDRDGPASIEVLNIERRFLTNKVSFRVLDLHGKPIPRTFADDNITVKTNKLNIVGEKESQPDMFGEDDGVITYTLTSDIEGIDQLIIEADTAKNNQETLTFGNAKTYLPFISKPPTMTAKINVSGDVNFLQEGESTLIRAWAGVVDPFNPGIAGSIPPGKTLTLTIQEELGCFEGNRNTITMKTIENNPNHATDQVRFYRQRCAGVSTQAGTNATLAADGLSGWVNMRAQLYDPDGYFFADEEIDDTIGFPGEPAQIRMGDWSDAFRLQDYVLPVGESKRLYASVVDEQENADVLDIPVPNEPVRFTLGHAVNEPLAVVDHNEQNFSTQVEGSNGSARLEVECKAVGTTTIDAIWNKPPYQEKDTIEVQCGRYNDIGLQLAQQSSGKALDNLEIPADLNSHIIIAKVTNEAEGSTGVYHQHVTMQTDHGIITPLDNAYRIDTQTAATDDAEVQFVLSNPELRVNPANTEPTRITARAGIVSFDGTVRFTAEECGEPNEKHAFEDGQDVHQGEACAGSFEDQNKMTSDWFKLELDETKVITIYLRNLQQKANYDLYLYRLLDTRPDNLDDSKAPMGKDEQIVNQTLTKGTYYLQVFAKEKANRDNTYTLAVIVQDE